jgi:hypothetical protein
LAGIPDRPYRVGDASPLHQANPRVEYVRILANASCAVGACPAPGGGNRVVQKSVGLRLFRDDGMTAGSDERGSTASEPSEDVQAPPSSGSIPRLLRNRFAQFGGSGRLLRWLRTATGAVSASVTLIAGILTVVFLLWPALRPEGGPTVLGASLSEPRLEMGVTLADVYTRRQSTPPDSYSAAQLATPGALVSFVAVIEGFQGNTCRLTWSLLDAETKTRVADETLLDQPGWPDGTFTPAAARDQAAGTIWIHTPDRPGSYIVRLELLGPDGRHLTSLDSEPFTVARSTAPDGPAPGGLPTPAAPAATRPAPGGSS